jgi:hypothetical protein
VKSETLGAAEIIPYPGLDLPDSQSGGGEEMTHASTLQQYPTDASQNLAVIVILILAPLR